MPPTNDQGLDQLQKTAPPAEEAWVFLDESTQEEGAEAEATQDLALLRENADTHLTAAIAAQVVRSPEDEAVIQVVLPHLCRCSWCRGTLRETLDLCGTEASHPAFALLAEAEDWAHWEDAGRQATQSAHQFLRITYKEGHGTIERAVKPRTLRRKP